MKNTCTTALALCLLTAAVATAQDMPSGPPEEMKKLAFYEGDWDIAMEWKMSDTEDVWTKSAATAHYEYVLDGAAMRMDFTSLDTLMPFTGLGLECYDRELGQWQYMWVDNLGSRIVLFTGVLGDGKAVYTGEDRWQGMTFLSRMSIFDVTDTGFKWTMEMSVDGGKTWQPSGRATYTKKM